jgi:hypothetical protein
MANTAVSALPAAGSFLLADELPVNEAGTSKKVTGTQIRTAIGAGLNNASVASVAGAYAADAYLAGSAITIPVAGGWAARSVLKWQFDMTKTAAGVATPILIVRMGTLGTTGDAAILTLPFLAATAVADLGIFDVTVNFRTVGGGTSAVINGMVRCIHQVAGGGLMTTVGSSTAPAIVVGVSSGFNSTTQTIIGLSFNGGASFSGTNTYVIAAADKL